MALKAVELTVTILYFVVCIGIAVYFTRRAGAGSTAYWAAERGIGVWVNGVGVFTTLVSGGSFLGFLGFTGQFGWAFAGVSLATGTTLGFVLLGLLVGGPLRRYSEVKGKFTLSNFFTERYGPAVGRIATILIIVILWIYIVPQLMAGGMAAQYVLGVSRTVAIVLVGAVILFYVLVGGMLSVTWTDFVQGILKFAMMVGLSWVAIETYGGIGPLIERASVEQPSLMSFNPKLSPWAYIGLPLGIAVFITSSPHTIMRLFTAQSVRKGRAALSLTAALCLVFHLFGYIGVGTAALVIAPDVLRTKGYDKSYLEVMDALFSPLLRGLAISAILAAVMSTTAGILLTVGAEFSVNVYKRFMRREATDREAIRASQILMLVIGISTVAGALVVQESIGKLIAMLVMAMGSAFSAPLLAGIWWKRANAVGGGLGIVGGLASYLAAGLSGHLPAFTEILVAFPVSLFGVVVGSLLTARPSFEKAQFVEALHTPTD
jgi:Na+/proline symporter